MSLIPFDRKNKIMVASNMQYRKIPHFSREEIQMIFEYLTNKVNSTNGQMKRHYQTYYLLTKMLYRTGARIEEILGGYKTHKDPITHKIEKQQVSGIRPKDIDLKHNSIYIVTLKHKKLEYRELAIHNDLRDALMSYYLDYNISQDSTEPLFSIKRAAYDRFLKKMGKELGFHINAHKFRHTTAVRLSEAGVPISRIQKILGHSNAFVTSVYLQTFDYKDDILRME